MTLKDETSKPVASKAGKLLRKENTTKSVKSVAGSALAQRADKPPTRRFKVHG